MKLYCRIPVSLLFSKSWSFNICNKKAQKTGTFDVRSRHLCHKGTHCRHKGIRSCGSYNPRHIFILLSWFPKKCETMADNIEIWSCGTSWINTEDNSYIEFLWEIYDGRQYNIASDDVLYPLIKSTISNKKQSKYFPLTGMIDDI